MSDALSDLSDLFREREERITQEIIDAFFRTDMTEADLERLEHLYSAPGTTSLADLPPDWAEYARSTPLDNINAARRAVARGYDLGPWHRTIAAGGGYPFGAGIPPHLDIIACGLPYAYPKHMEWQCWCGRTWYREADEYWWTPVLYLGGPVVWRKVPR